MHETQTEVRIAVIDDHPVARYGMQMIFARVPGLNVVYEACSLAALASWPSADVIIIDLYLNNGRLSSREIAAATRRCPVLIVSASHHRDDVLTAIQAGASGYLTKDSSAESFIAAVRSVADAHFYVSSQVADLLDDDKDNSHADGSRIILAPREREALSYIAQGFTQAQTAKRMGVSPGTIDTYLKRIRAKLGPGNKADLIRRASALDGTNLNRSAFLRPGY